MCGRATSFRPPASGEEQKQTQEQKLTRMTQLLRIGRIIPSFVAWKLRGYGAVLPPCRPAAVEQDTADEGYAGGYQPLAAPDLNGLPILEGFRGVKEAGNYAGDYAEYSGDEADHCAY